MKLQSVSKEPGAKVADSFARGESLDEIEQCHFAIYAPHREQGTRTL